MADTKASDHVKPCNIAKSELHNRRDEDYLNAINKDKIYIRRDFTYKNESYVSPTMNGVELQTYYEQIKVMVKEKTGRAMQEKDVVYKKKNGKEGIRKGSSPIRESVVNITADTTMEQLRNYADRVRQRWGITAIQIHIHRDEGHYENPEDPSSWKPNLHAHIIWDWMDHSTGKSCKLNADDMSELQNMVADSLQMERGNSKSETNLEHLERNDYIIHKQENRKRLLEEEQKKALLEKKVAEEKAAKAVAAKDAAELEQKQAEADKEESQHEHIRIEAIISRNIEKNDALIKQYSQLVNQHNELVKDYNNIIDYIDLWKCAEDWQKYFLDYYDKAMYENDQLVKYTVDSLISYAKNDDGRGGHQDFLHDEQSTAVKMVMKRYSPNDKSVWMKIAAWLLHLAKSLGHLGEQAVLRISKEIASVANGNYDWRIERFMRNSGLSR